MKKKKETPELQESTTEITKVHYTCKRCGWSTNIPAIWQDLKPKKCANRKCKTFFLVNPEELLIETK